MRLTHGRITLELHELTHRDGLPLLLLHALWGSSADWGEAPATWPGPAYALDFSGHGRSDWLTGGGYVAELLVADADAALAQIGRAAVVGAGLGAYIAVLLAGARPDLVPAALLLPGTGLAGGGPQPQFTQPHLALDVPAAHEPATGQHDPMVRVLDREVRPPDYVLPLAHAAHRLLLGEDGGPRPPWWEAIRQCPRAESTPAGLLHALARLHATIA